eukprot:scpid52746/ scgid12636/ 
MHHASRVASLRRHDPVAISLLAVLLLGKCLLLLGDPAGANVANQNVAQGDEDGGSAGGSVRSVGSLNCTCTALADCVDDAAMLDSSLYAITLCVCQNDSSSTSFSCSELITSLIDLHMTASSNASSANMTSAALTASMSPPTPIAMESSGPANASPTGTGVSQSASLTMATRALTGIGASGASDDPDGWLGVAWWYWIAIIGASASLLTALIAVLCTARCIRRRQRNKITFNSPYQHRRGSSQTVEGRFIHMHAKTLTGPGMGASGEVFRHRGSIASELSSDTALSHTLPVSSGSRPTRESTRSNGTAGPKCSYTMKAASPSPVQGRPPAESNGSTGGGSSGGGGGDGFETSSSHHHRLNHTYDEPSVDMAQVSPTRLRTFTGYSDSENSGSSEAGYMYMARQARMHKQSAAPQPSSSSSQQQQQGIARKTSSNGSGGSKLDTLERPLLKAAADMAVSDDDVTAESCDQDDGKGQAEQDHARVDPAAQLKQDTGDADHKDGDVDPSAEAGISSLKRSASKGRAPPIPGPKPVGKVSDASSSPGSLRKPNKAPPARPAETSPYSSAVKIQQKLREQQRLHQQRRLLHRRFTDITGTTVQAPAAIAAAAAGAGGHCNTDSDIHNPMITVSSSSKTMKTWLESVFRASDAGQWVSSQAMCNGNAYLSTDEKCSKPV